MLLTMTKNTHMVHYSQVHQLGEIVLIWVLSMGQIDLFKNYFYSIGPCKKKKKKKKKKKAIQKKCKNEHPMNVIP